MQSEELALFNDAVYPDNVLYQALKPGLAAANFVFSTDLEWDSEVFNGSYNYPACGVIFRAEDLDEGEQAHFNIVLVNPTAYSSWEIELWNSGQYQSTIASSLGDAIQGADSTNHFLIVADGSIVTVFANGARLDSVTLPASLSKGEFGILARAGPFCRPRHYQLHLHQYLGLGIALSICLLNGYVIALYTLSPYSFLKAGKELIQKDERIRSSCFSWIEIVM